MSIFSKIEKTVVPGNGFDLTHDRKLSGKIGRLIPTCVMDLIPGDKFTIDTAAMVRFAPLVAPVMHQVAVYFHYFFVPNRLVWPNWEDFITGGENGLNASVWPNFTINVGANISTGNLNDYMGIPTKIGGITVNNRVVSAIPWAAYQKIYNEYYRDQNLIIAIPDTLIDGDNTVNAAAMQTLRKRAWQHDYFTSALPFTQKGPAVTIPIAGNAPIVYDLLNTQFQEVRDGTLPHAPIISSALGSVTAGIPSLTQITGNSPRQLDISGTHFADLSGATQSTINDLRRAFKLQEWLEKNARGGSRYIESISVHFGVQSSDRRLQRPEFIGGYRAPIKISEVLQTSALLTGTGIPTTTPQGTMTGHAVGIGGSGKISYQAEEHGYIMGIMSVMPRSAYQQGIPKHLLRNDRFDYYWPEFAHIGEQPIEEQEIFQREGENGTRLFGYTPRYAEYKYIPSTVHGDFRTTLDFWHMGRIFATPPALNQNFIECNFEEVDRIFAVTDGSDNLWCHILNEVKAYRKMPIFGTPKF